MHSKQLLLYWSLQLAGWGAYFGLCAGLMLLSNPKIIVLWAWLFILAGHLALSHGLRHVIRHWHWLDSSPAKVVAKLFGACGFLAVAVNVLLAPIPPILGLNSLAAQFGMFRYFVPFSFFLFAVWSLFYVAFQYFFRYRD